MREGLTESFLDPFTAVVLASLINLEPLGSPGIEFVAGRRPAGGQVSDQRAWGRNEGD